MRPLFVASTLLIACATRGTPTPAPASAPVGAPPPVAAAPAETLDESVRDEILAMFREDQALRRELGSGDIENPPPDLIGRGIAMDARNRERLRAILDEHGWPGIALVGERAASAAVFLAIHADRDLEFQKRCLELMKAAAHRGDVDKPSLALLVDRVRTNEDKKQLYGTQAELVDGKLVPTPIEDPEHVDERRAEMDMPPLAEHLQRQQAHFDAMQKKD